MDKLIADLLLFGAGSLLCNSIPHLASGLRGDSFPTPFATPPGAGNSPPLTNFLWGSANALAGAALLASHSAALDWAGIFALAIGFLAIGSYLAWHFGKVRGGR